MAKKHIRAFYAFQCTLLGSNVIFKRINCFKMQTISQAVGELSLWSKFDFCIYNKSNLLDVHLLWQMYIFENSFQSLIDVLIAKCLWTLQFVQCAYLRIHGMRTRAQLKPKIELYRTIDNDDNPFDFLLPDDELHQRKKCCHIILNVDVMYTRYTRYKCQNKFTLSHLFFCK